MDPSHDSGLIAVDQGTYVSTIERCFIEIRGRGVQWSPADADRARAWHALGIPLPAAIRVLHARLRAWKFSHGEDAKVPIHLRWYEPALLQHCRHLVRLGVDPLTLPEDALPAEPTLPLLVDELLPLQEAAGHVALRHAYRKAFDLLDRGLQPEDGEDAAVDAGGEASGPPVPSAELDDAAVDTLLDRCRALLVRTVGKGLQDAEMDALEAHLDERLRPLQRQLSKKALAMRRSALTELWLAEHLGLRVPTRAGWLDPREIT